MKFRTRIAAVIAAAGMAGTLAVSTAGAASAATKTKPSSANAERDHDHDCDNGHWPGVVQGRPSTLQDGAAEGVYVWHDDDGWHLQVTHPGHDKVVFTGRIQSATRMAATPRHDEKADVVLERGEKSVSFRFTNYGYIDGLDFRTACSPRLTFSFKVNGKKLPALKVFTGSANNHPKSDPFTLRRVK
jgi:hypothetical protein